MNILIVDKKYHTPSYVNEWKAYLEKKGHKVKEGKTLNELLGESKDLGSYNAVIAHPNIGQDAQLLYNEVEKRKDFKVILYYSGSAHDHQTIDKLLDKSGQVFYSFVLSKEDVANLVEVPWDRLPMLYQRTSISRVNGKE